MGGYLFAAACVALLCACYAAGRAALPARWTAAVAVAALCVPLTQLAIRPIALAAVTGFVSAYLVFAALPLLAGRYVAQQRKVADRERLRERLRIARDMHDSLGRRLSLAAVQAAALEVADLPAPQRAAAARLGTAVRASVAELHEILHVLRGERETARGMSAVDVLVEEFEAAAVVEVSLRSRGMPRPLPVDADQAAYRVIEEGLTNAVRHAPGRPVSATVVWEADAVLISVVNATDCRAYTPGSGLAGLTERLSNTGGYLDHELSGGQFLLRAAIPAAVSRRGAGRLRISALGLAAGVLLLVILPVTVLLGVS
ncbi:MAG TPA: histidine kinase [Streptosporangiaceae bacterium]